MWHSATSFDENCIVGFLEELRLSDLAEHSTSEKWTKSDQRLMLKSEESTGMTEARSRST
jgi:hypothetical protein